jgi:monoamine oxidase
MSDLGDTTTRVAVIGAGLSGLVCARRLARARIDVRVLEARDRVGGRTLSRGGFDLGAQWMSANQPRLAALASELGVATTPQFRDGQIVLSRPEGLRSLLGGLERRRRLRELDRLSRDPPDGDMSLAAWLERRVKRADARAMIALAAELETAADPRRVSLLYYLAALRACGGFAPGREVRFAGGAQTLCELIAIELGDRVELGRAVTSIDQSTTGVEIATAGGPPVSAARCVLAVPPSLCASIQVAGRTAARDAAESAMPPGNVIKLIAIYDRPFWRDDGLSGEAYSIGTRVRATADCSTGDRWALAAFVVGDAPPGDPIDELAGLFGDAAATPREVIERDWSTDPWAGGCVANALPGSDLDLEALRAPCGRVHYAGSETAREWPRYLEGAVEAGERAAAEIIALAR